MADKLNLIYNSQLAEDLIEKVEQTGILSDDDFNSVMTTYLIKNLELAIGLIPSKREIKIGDAGLTDTMKRLQAIETKNAIINDLNFTEKYGANIHRQIKEIVISDYETHLETGEKYSDLVMANVKEIDGEIIDGSNVQIDAMRHFIHYFEKWYENMQQKNVFITEIADMTERAETHLQEMESNAWRTAYILQSMRFNEYIKAEGKEPHNESMVLDNMNDEQIEGLVDTYKRMRVLDRDLFVYRSFIEITANALEAPQLTYKLNRYATEEMPSIILLSQDIEAIKDILKDNLDIVRFSFLDKMQHLEDTLHISTKHLNHYALSLKEYIYTESTSQTTMHLQFDFLKSRLQAEYKNTLFIRGVDDIGQ